MGSSTPIDTQCISSGAGQPTPSPDACREAEITGIAQPHYFIIQSLGAATNSLEAHYEENYVTKYTCGGKEIFSCGTSTGISDLAGQSGKIGEDVATEATEASCDVTQPWDMPQETVEATAPVDMQDVTGLEEAVAV
ncbi:hypothetical protein LSAT2_000289 [Lamellibrachia satsuma]|nr:hypothetical protein LSAT2_000289 [Lamellibrachia satsuma]